MLTCCVQMLCLLQCAEVGSTALLHETVYGDVLCACMRTNRNSSPVTLMQPGQADANLCNFRRAGGSGLDQCISAHGNLCWRRHFWLFLHGLLLYEVHLNTWHSYNIYCKLLCSFYPKDPHNNHSFEIPNICTNACIHASTHARACACAPTHAPTHTPAHVHTRTRTCTHAHAPMHA